MPDVHHHRVVALGVGDLAPDGLEQIARGHRPALVAHETGEDGELLRGEAQRLAVQRGRVGALVESDAAAFEHIRPILPCDVVRDSAAQARADAGHELARLEGLHHVVVGTQLEAHHLVDLLVLRREEDYGNRARAPKLATAREPVHTGHHDVEDDKVERIVRLTGQQIGSCVEHRRGEPGLDKQLPHQIGDGLLVVAYGDAHLRFHAFLLALRGPSGRPRPLGRAVSPIV